MKVDAAAGAVVLIERHKIVCRGAMRRAGVRSW
jgi:hypothetical protein